MQKIDGITGADVTAAYDGAEGRLYELFMGELLHIGGYRSSVELAEAADIEAGSHGVDLCCGRGASMRFLIRMRQVESMVGVEASGTMIENGRHACRAEGLADRIRFVQADACTAVLREGEADFVWGEDAWCYVADKQQLVAEAVRLVRPGGVIAFTDWVEGENGLGPEGAEALMRLMHFSSLQDVKGYRQLLEAHGCEVVEAADTGRFARCFELYQRSIEEQLTYDALRIVDFNEPLLSALLGQLGFVAELGRTGKLGQARFVARKH